VSRLRQVLGLDAIDLFIHIGVTLALMGFVGVSGGPEELYPVLSGLSLLVLGVRRSLALRMAGRRGLSTGEMAAVRIAELDQRMAELEAAQGRVAELEERLDFTERLLAKSAAEPRALGRGPVS
jgi:hypothetical protein